MALTLIIYFRLVYALREASIELDKCYLRFQQKKMATSLFSDECPAPDWRWRFWFGYGYCFHSLHQVGYSFIFIYNSSKQMVHSVLSLQLSKILNRTPCLNKNYAFKCRYVWQDKRRTTAQVTSVRSFRYLLEICICCQSYGNPFCFVCFRSAHILTVVSGRNKERCTPEIKVIVKLISTSFILIKLSFSVSHLWKLMNTQQFPRVSL